MKKMLKIQQYLLLFMMLFSAVMNAQEDDQTKSDAPKTAAEIAEELANPNTVLGTMNFNFDYVNYQGDLPDAGGQNSFVIGFQPVLPIPLNKTMNLYIRPQIPLVVTQPTYDVVTGFENQKAGLGNISADVAVGKTFPSKTIAVVGAFASFRTASHKALKSPYTFIGPEFVIAQLFKWGAAGVMVNYAWSVNNIEPTTDAGGIYSIMGNDVFVSSQGGETAQITAGQYFYVVSMGDGWQFTASPTYSINHNAPKGEKVTFPIGAGASKVTFFGKMPVKFNMQYWYYVASPSEFGPQHQVRLTISPVVPLPW